MPLLTGAITFLSLAGTPGVATYTADQEAGSGRADGGIYTTLSLNGGPGRYSPLFDTPNQNDKQVSDTYILRLTLGDVSNIDAEVSDLYVPRLTLTAVANLVRAVSDNYVPRMTLARQSLVQSGTIPKAASDTYIPVLTLGRSLAYQIAIADSYVPVLTLAAVNLDKSDAKTASDSYVPVLTLTVETLAKTVASVSWSLSDTYLPRLTLSATVAEAGEVDSIRITSRPMGRIKIRTV